MKQVEVNMKNSNYELRNDLATYHVFKTIEEKKTCSGITWENHVYQQSSLYDGRSTYTRNRWMFKNSNLWKYSFKLQKGPLVTRFHAVISKENSMEIHVHVCIN